MTGRRKRGRQSARAHPVVRPADRDAGVSIVELLVSITILGLGAALSIGVLALANERVEQAELDLRAAIYLGALARTDTAAIEPADRVRVAGPGHLVLETAGDPMEVRYEPPVSSPGAPDGPRGGGFHAPQMWQLSIRP